MATHAKEMSKESCMILIGKTLFLHKKQGLNFQCFKGVIDRAGVLQAEGYNLQMDMMILRKRVTLVIKMTNVAEIAVLIMLAGKCAGLIARGEHTIF